MPFAPGTEVLVRSLGSRPGVVVEVDRRNRHRVRMGSALMWCEERDLTAADARAAGAGRKARVRRQAEAAIGVAGASDVDTPPPLSSLDLHGLTVDEAMTRTVAEIDRVLQIGAASLEIVHGKGTGRIKAALHRLLASMPVVRSFELDRRNPGVTHVRF